MLKHVCAVACFTCAVQARRVQPVGEYLQNGQTGESVEPSKHDGMLPGLQVHAEVRRSGWTAHAQGTLDPLKALAMFCLAFNAAVAFEASSVAARFPMGSCRIVVYCLLWWSGSLLVTMTIKETVSPGGVFPYSFAFTALTQMATGSLAWLISAFTSSVSKPLPPLQRKEVMYLVLYGIMQGVEIALTNKALSYLTISERTFMGSTNVFFVMLTAWAWGLERIDLFRIGAIILLVLGGSVTACEERTRAPAGGLLFYGMVMQLASTIVASQRWALAQVVLQKSPPESALGQMSKLQLLARVLPVTGLVCLPLALVFEQHAFSASQLMQPDLFVSLFTVSFGLTIMLSSELKLIQVLSAVAFNVLAALHQILNVIAGVFFNHDHVGAVSASGFGCCIIGALVYAHARALDREESSLKAALSDRASIESPISGSD